MNIADAFALALMTVALLTSMVIAAWFDNPQLYILVGTLTGYIGKSLQDIVSRARHKDDH